MGRITSHKELDVYRLSFEVSMEIFVVSRDFPSEERYSLVDQMRRSSRAVCANIAEAWRKRRYQKAFVLCLNNAEAEAAETQTWVDFALKCNYLHPTQAENFHKTYDNVIGKLVNMIHNPTPWILPK
mgnify:CR=1 FL=1